MLGTLIATTLMLGLGAPSTPVQADAAGQKKDAPGPPTPWFDKDEDNFDLPKDPKVLADMKHDVEVGKKAAAEVLTEEKASTNMDYQARVERVGQKIAHIANHMHAIASWGDKRFFPFHYRYTVLKGDEINAFSLPGGYIFIYEGLMKFVESDDELAGVLAHETAHAAFRHVAKLENLANRQLLYEIPAIIASVLTHSMAGVEGADLMMQSFRSGWSIEAEKSADYGGFQFMAKSSFNPVAMLTFMERLAKTDRLYNGLFKNTIYQTHPITKDRADAMIDDLHNAGIAIERSKASPAFRVHLKDAPDGSVVASFEEKPIYTFGGPDAKSRAEQAADALNHFYDAVPNLIDVTEDTQANAIMWKGRPVLTVDPEDAAACKTTTDKLLDKTFKAVKISLFALTYRLWNP